MRNRWGALGAMTGIQIAGSFGFYALTVLTPFIKTEFGLTRSGVGLLVVALYAGYLVSLLPGGILTDQLGERAILAVAVVSIAVGAVLVSLVPAYWLLFVGLLIIGAGYGPVPSGTNKGVFDWFPVEQRTTGLSIKQTGVMAGTATAGVVLPTLAARTDWRLAMGVVAGVMVVSLGILAVYLRPADAPTAEQTRELRDIRRELRSIVRLARRRRFGLLLASGFFFGASQFTLLAYVILYLTEELLVVPAVAGFLYTVMQLSGGGTRIVLGFVTDAWFTDRKHLLLAGTGIFGGLAYLPLVGLSDSTPVLFVTTILLILGAMTLGYNGVYLTIAGELVGPEETGSATAVAVTAIIGGAVVTPPVFGHLADVTDGFTVSFGLLTILCLLAGVAAFHIGSYRPFGR
jgi:MFS family permease